jgi:hypothetical protein
VFSGEVLTQLRMIDSIHFPRSSDFFMVNPFSSQIRVQDV